MKPTTKDAQAYVIEQGDYRIVITKWRKPTPSGNEYCLEFHRRTAVDTDELDKFIVAHVELTKETLDALQNAIESLTT